MRWLAVLILLVVACGTPEDDGTTQDPPTTGPSGGTDSATGSVDSTTQGTTPETTVLILSDDPPSGPEASGLEGLPLFDNVVQPGTCDVPACDGNTAPVVTERTILVNGVAATADTVIRVGDRVGVLFDYEDPDCNAACGDGRSEVSNALTVTFGSLFISSELPCDTASSGVTLGIDFFEVDAPGDYSTEVTLRDACDEPSAPSQVEFEVVP